MLFDRKSVLGDYKLQMSTLARPCRKVEEPPATSHHLGGSRQTNRHQVRDPGLVKMHAPSRPFPAPINGAQLVNINPYMKIRVWLTRVSVHSIKISRQVLGPIPGEISCQNLSQGSSSGGEVSTLQIRPMPLNRPGSRPSFLMKAPQKLTYLFPFKRGQG